MKKTLFPVLLLSVFSASFAENQKNNGQIVSIDSIMLMQDSKEGKALAAKFQKEVEAFRLQVKEEQEKLVEAQKKLEKQSKILSKTAKLEKEEELVKMKKMAERNLVDKEESLKTKVQREQFALREKQMKVVSDISKKSGWAAVIDKNTPGVLFVNSAIDKTSKVLKVVDKKYSEEISNKKADA